MFLVGLISWWYGTGLRRQGASISERLSATAEFFSIGQLASTLFAPFRQISAGQVRGPVAVQLRAFFDRSFSRVFGAIIRLCTIIFALLTLLLQLIYLVIVFVGWLIVPILPVVGLIAAVIGWVPYGQ